VTSKFKSLDLNIVGVYENYFFSVPGFALIVLRIIFLLDYWMLALLFSKVFRNWIFYWSEFKEDDYLWNICLLVAE